jgi:hypothetical protein
MRKIVFQINPYVRDGRRIATTVVVAHICELIV